jgi:hypothetical protein
VGAFAWSGCSSLDSKPPDSALSAEADPEQSSADDSVSGLRPGGPATGVGTGFSDQARDIERSLGYK